MTSYLVGLVGAGIGPSLSPALHEREADHHGLRYLYRTIDIADLGLDASAAGDLVRTARRLGYTGLNITHPCKQTVIDHLDELSPEAARLGAVNTVTFDGERAIGHNTDSTGFARSFARGLPEAPTRRIVQLGAGGAGAAVAHALLNLGAGRLTVVDERESRATSLAADLVNRYGAGRARAASAGELAGYLSGADGLVNATPVGGIEEIPGEKIFSCSSPTRRR
jgi:shikimate dehydrogenase